MDLQFESELISLLNRHSAEAASDTPDYILAQYLHACLRVFDATVWQREDWYGKNKEKFETRNKAVG